MKLILVVLLAVSSVFAAEEIDWSKVRPVEEFPVFRAALEANLPPLSAHKPIAPRIVNGRIAREFPRQFPFQVAIVARFQFGDGLCGGSVLNARNVLTAAHW